jgi:hypothetical protein
VKLAGWFLLGLAALIVLFALRLETETAAYVASGAGDGTMQATRAPSLALLQRQMMLFQLGLAAFIGGVLLHVGSELAARLGGRPWAGEETPTGAASAAPQRRPAGRGELIAGGVMVGVILLILVVVAMSGRGGGGAAVNSALPPELMNDAEAALLDEEPRPTRAERNAAASLPKPADPAPATDVPGSDPSTAGNPAQPATPPPPPTSNSAGDPPGNGF